ncbi:hypothetical protein GCM10009838_11650 [Catenulispora subtropica]|uniref:Uncharacterized protein n=1 Tax=Catenulispora subtropica TaxID=450798 RepID=A0ABN2QRV1_9ACTN
MSVGVVDPGTGTGFPLLPAAIEACCGVSSVAGRAAVTGVAVAAEAEAAVLTAAVPPRATGMPAAVVAATAATAAIASRPRGDPRHEW